MQLQIIRDILSHSNENLRNKSSLNDNDLKTFNSLFSEHGIWGQIQHKSSLISHKKKEIQFSNLFFNDQFSQLRELLTKNNITQLTPIKGVSLLRSIYPDWKQRKMSDIDVYLPAKHKAKLHQVMINNNYNLLDDKKWSANNHKSTYIKKHNFIDVTIEVHFKLYYHTNYEPGVEIKNDVTYLSKEDELLFLCYHLAEQHNFIKLFWLKDIALYINKFGDSMDWNRFHFLANKIGITRSTESCLYLCHKYLAAKPYYKSKNLILKKIINWDYLCYPYKSKVKYFLLKNYLKGPRSFSYLINWIRNYKN